MAAEIDEILAIPVDRTKPIPLYIQIADGVRAFLQGGAFVSGMMLPPERVLCERYAVNRLTLRQAFDLLERDGVIERQHGRGTMVARRLVQKEQQDLRSFTEDITARGGTPSSRLLSFNVITPGVVEREFFNLPEGEQIYRIRRLRFKDGIPLALETVQMPRCLCPGLDQFNLATDSIYRILENEFGVELGRGIEEISAERPNRFQRQILSLPRSVVVLQVNRRTYTKNGTPLEMTVSVYRADLYRTIVHSVRAQRGP